MTSPGFLFLKHENNFRRALIVIGMVVLVWQFITAFRPQGDFLLHWEFGQRFLHHQPLYAGGMHVPYPPFWAMAHAPLALIPVGLAKPAFYLLGLAAVLLMIRLFVSLAPAEGQTFWVAALALLLASRFIIRDLADGGQNLVLLALVWSAIWLWMRQLLTAAGIALGLAVALKCTALIFVGWFLWKRQWRMASISLTAALGFTLAPITWMGAQDYAAHMSQWGGTLRAGATQPDPSTGVLGPEKFQNHSLRPSLARFFMTVPPDHPGRYASPWYLDFLALPPRAASLLILAITLLLGGTTAWRLRQPLTPSVAVWQFAVLGVLVLLVSPITWGQHCVAAWPALWLLARDAVIRKMGWKYLAVFAVLVLLTNRAFLGKPLSLLLESYHVTTVALIVLLAATLAGARRAAAEAGAQKNSRAIADPAVL